MRCCPLRCAASSFYQYLYSYEYNYSRTVRVYYEYLHAGQLVPVLRVLLRVLAVSVFIQ